MIRTLGHFYSVHDQSRAIRSFVKLVNGKWVLVKRINPDGTEHAEPLRGVTTIGTIRAEESGILDARFGECVPAGSANKPFEIESIGTWQVSLNRTTLELINRVGRPDGVSIT